MMENKIRVAELFAGIGAQRQALKDAGINHEIVAISEIDKYALLAYEKLHGPTFNLGDICKIEKIPASDLWTYSFPCTDISLAGRLGGFARGSNTKSSLLWEVQRLLEVSKVYDELPKYLLMENVKNLVSKKFKPLFLEWVDYLSSLGYKSFYKVMNAKDYGIPQNRERVFMVSILDANASFEFPEKCELKKKLIDYLEDEVDEKYFLSEKLIDCFSSMQNRNGLIRGLRFRPRGKDVDYAFTITTCPGNRATDNFIIEPIPVAMRGRERDGDYRQVIEPKSDGIANAITTVQKDSMVIVPQNTKRGFDIAKVGDGIYVNRASSKRGVVQKEKIPTLKTSCSDVAVVVNDLNDYISIRKLTPRECWRLMGWNDDEIDKVMDGTISNTQLYKMAGNSIVVNCLMAVFNKLYAKA